MPPLPRLLLTLTTILIIILSTPTTCTTTTNPHQQQHPKLNALNLLLPPHATTPFRIHVTQQCWHFVTTDEEVVTITEEYDPSCPPNLTRVALIQPNNNPGTCQVLVHGDTETLSVEVHVKPISRIEILTTVRRLGVGEPETIFVQARDDEENVFSSIAGLPIRWSTETRDILHLTTVEDSIVDPGNVLDACSGSSENAPTTTSSTDWARALIVEGVKAGSEWITAEYLNLSTRVQLHVSESLTVCPPIFSLWPGIHTPARFCQKPSGCGFLPSQPAPPSSPVTVEFSSPELEAMVQFTQRRCFLHVPTTKEIRPSSIIVRDAMFPDNFATGIVTVSHPQSLQVFFTPFSATLASQIMSKICQDDLLMIRECPLVMPGFGARDWPPIARGLPDRAEWSSQPYLVAGTEYLVLVFPLLADGSAGLPYPLVDDIAFVMQNPNNNIVRMSAKAFTDHARPCSNVSPTLFHIQAMREGTTPAGLHLANLTRTVNITVNNPVTFCNQLHIPVGGMYVAAPVGGSGQIVVTLHHKPNNNNVYVETGTTTTGENHPTITLHSSQQQQDPEEALATIMLYDANNIHNRVLTDIFETEETMVPSLTHLTVGCMSELEINLLPVDPTINAGCTGRLTCAHAIVDWTFEDPDILQDLGVGSNQGCGSRRVQGMKPGTARISVRGGRFVFHITVMRPLVVTPFTEILSDMDEDIVVSLQGGQGRLVLRGGETSSTFIKVRGPPGSGGGRGPTIYHLTCIGEGRKMMQAQIESSPGPESCGSVDVMVQCARPSGIVIGIDDSTTKRKDTSSCLNPSDQTWTGQHVPFSIGAFQLSLMSGNAARPGFANQLVGNRTVEAFIVAVNGEKNVFTHFSPRTAWEVDSPDHSVQIFPHETAPTRVILSLSSSPGSGTLKASATSGSTATVPGVQYYSLPFTINVNLPFRLEPANHQLASFVAGTAFQARFHVTGGSGRFECTSPGGSAMWDDCGRKMKIGPRFSTYRGMIEMRMSDEELLGSWKQCVYASFEELQTIRARMERQCVYPGDTVMLYVEAVNAKGMPFAKSQLGFFEFIVSSPDANVRASSSTTTQKEHKELMERFGSEPNSLFIVDWSKMEPFCADPVLEAQGVATIVDRMHCAGAMGIPLRFKSSNHTIPGRQAQQPQSARPITIQVEVRFPLNAQGQRSFTDSVKMSLSRSRLAIHPRPATGLFLMPGATVALTASGGPVDDTAACKWGSSSQHVKLIGQQVFVAETMMGQGNITITCQCPINVQETHVQHVPVSVLDRPHKVQVSPQFKCVKRGHTVNWISMALTEDDDEIITGNDCYDWAWVFSTRDLMVKGNDQQSNRIVVHSSPVENTKQASTDHEQWVRVGFAPKRTCGRSKPVLESTNTFRVVEPLHVNQSDILLPVGFGTVLHANKQVEFRLKCGGDDVGKNSTSPQKEEEEHPIQVHPTSGLVHGKRVGSCTVVVHASECDETISVLVQVRPVAGILLYHPVQTFKNAIYLSVGEEMVMASRLLSGMSREFANPLVPRPVFYAQSFDNAGVLSFNDEATMVKALAVGRCTVEFVLMMAGSSSSSSSSSPRDIVTFIVVDDGKLPQQGDGQQQQQQQQTCLFLYWDGVCYSPMNWSVFVVLVIVLVAGLVWTREVTGGTITSDTSLYGGDVKPLVVSTSVVGGRRVVKATSPPDRFVTYTSPR